MIIKEERGQNYYMNPTFRAGRRKTVLVTGGAGFVGSHLCEALLAKEYDVICLDNLFTSSKENIRHLMDHPRFEFVRHDITQPTMLEVDEIYNLACPASPVHYQYNPVKTFKTSVVGALNMLGLAKRVGAKILQASTSEIYGDPSVHPQPESYWGNVNPIGPRSCYDEGKRAAETLFFDYWRQHKIPIRVVRIFNTYGPRMAKDDGRVVSNFIVQALRGEDLPLHGEGLSRSFQYIDDLVRAMILMMENKSDFIGPVNIGNPNEFTMRELADLVLKLTGSKSKIKLLPNPREDDPKQRQPDITLAKEKLGWEPKVPLEEGLNKTIEYFRAVMK